MKALKRISFFWAIIFALVPIFSACNLNPAVDDPDNQNDSDSIIAVVDSVIIDLTLDMPENSIVYGVSTCFCYNQVTFSGWYEYYSGDNRHFRHSIVADSVFTQGQPGVYVTAPIVTGRCNGRPINFILKDCLPQTGELKKGINYITLKYY